MPTLIWRQESDFERFWEKVSPLPVPADQHFPCPYCQQRFRSLLELKEHVDTSHFLELPALLLRGSQAPSEVVIRRSFLEAEVQLVSCTDCHVTRNGEPRYTSVGDFPAEFARDKCAHWSIRLVNARGSAGARAEREYRVDLRIPESSELDTVDRLFIRRLAVDRPEHRDIERFLKDCHVDPPAGDYVGALVNYVLGVMIKEQERCLIAPVGFDEYRSKLLEAESVLREFYRPVAQTITGCVEFNLNGFTDQESLPDLRALRAGFRLFHAIARATWPEPLRPESSPQCAAPVCPVDTVTSALLSFCERYMGEESLNAGDAERLERLETVRLISEYDLPKIHVLCSLVFLAVGDRGRAKRHLQQIRFDSLFGEWSRTTLEDEA